ncbi:hypothetical protein AB0C06_13880 [Micromonospora inaquosa]|uniref:hypothetical protein n=1 Tax=Micromonospora inaquosa TaxID=2203716 RepID=UPI0033CC4586
MGDVATAVRFALAVCTPGASQTINLGSGIGTDMASVVTTAEQVTGRPVTVHRQPPRPEPPALIADINRARTILGWSPGKSTLNEIVEGAWQARPRD